MDCMALLESFSFDGIDPTIEGSSMPDAQRPAGDNDSTTDDFVQSSAVDRTAGHGDGEMAHLKIEITAYDKQREDLETKYLGQWVVFHDRQLHDVYDSFEEAITSAAQAYGRGPYLIRQVGANSPVILALRTKPL